MKRKREYKEKLEHQLIKHQEFLFEQLRKEWEQLQKDARREQIVREVKETGQKTVVMTAKTILALLAIGGVLAVGTIAPNVLGAVGRSTSSTRKNYFFNKKNFNGAKNYLKKQNYIKFKKSGKTFELEMTDKGMTKILQTAFNQLKITEPKKWDGIWRIVIFDIPDRHKWARDGFRSKITEMGFYQMQKSVFVTPYPCDKEIEFLASVFNISNYIRLIETTHLTPDNDVGYYFCLM